MDRIFLVCADEKSDSHAIVSACTQVIDQLKAGAYGRGSCNVARYNAVGAAYNARAWQRYLNGEYDIAIRDYTDLIALMNQVAPKDQTAANVYSQRAASYNEKGDYDRAIADYGQAIRINPKGADFYSDRGLVWQKKQDYDRALVDFNQAIRLQPESASYSLRAQAWRLKGDLDRALVDHDQAIRLDTQNQQAISRLKRADTLRFKGELTRALADYEESLRLIPDYLPALTGRGLTYERQGDLLRARRDFEATAISAARKSALQGHDKAAFETARARLAALDSGAPQPVIPAPPSKAKSTTAIPTPALAPPAVTAQVAPQGRRVALIIANASYQNVSALTNPQRDAEAVAALLQKIGFEVVTVAADATREKLVDALRGFAEESEKADWAVVYYAGHGIEVNGVNYLIPVDARLAADRDVQFEAVPLDQVMTSVEGAKKLKLIILDACRDNPFAPQMRKTESPGPVASVATAGGTIGARSVGRGLAEMKVSAGSLVVYAAKHGQVALDGEGGNSPFAVALIQRITTPGVEINKIFRLIRDDVMEATAGRQEPFTYGSLPGREDFFFVAGK